MPTQRFPLERGGPARLDVSWKALWKDLTVRLDGETVGTVPTRKELSAGREFTLPEGSRLRVQLVQSGFGTELRIFHNDQPLPGSASDPETRLRGAYAVTLFIGGLNILLGAAAVALRSSFLRQMGIGAFSILFGLLFLVLGYFVKRASLVALLMAIAVFAIDGVLGFFGASAQGYAPTSAGLIARLFLLLPLVQGLGAIRALKRAGSGA